MKETWEFTRLQENGSKPKHIIDSWKQEAIYLHGKNKWKTQTSKLHEFSRNDKYRVIEESDTTDVILEKIYRDSTVYCFPFDEDDFKLSYSDPCFSFSWLLFAHEFIELKNGTFLW